MSVERIKEVMTLIGERVTMTSKDVERLQQIPQDKRNKIMKVLGGYNDNQNKAHDSYNKFMDIAGVKHGDVTMYDEQDVLVGDDMFTKTFQVVENEADVTQFLFALLRTVNDNFPTNQRMTDVHIRGEKVQVYLHHATGDIYDTASGQLQFDMNSIGSGKGKVKTIIISFIDNYQTNYKGSHPVDVDQFYVELENSSYFKSSGAILDAITHTVSFN